MFPVTDVIPSRTRPLVTMALIALNALAFGYEWTVDDAALRSLVHQRGLVPAAFSWPDVFWSLFLHAGWLHVAANVLCLWLFGANVEDRLGRFRYVVFYLGCGLAAAMVHISLTPNSTVPMIGASGALAGVMGAYFVWYPQSRVLTAVFAVVFFDLVEIPAIFYLGSWFLAQLFTDAGTIGARTAQGSAAFLSYVSAFGIGAISGLYWRFREQTLRGYWVTEVQKKPTRAEHLPRA